MLAVAVLLVAALAHLDTAPTRRRIVALVEAGSKVHLQGQVRLRRLDAVSVQGLTLRGLAVVDPAGRVALGVRRLDVRWQITDLFRRRLHVRSLRLDGVRVALYPGRTGGGVSLADAFMPRQASEDDSAAASPWALQMPQVVVRALTVRHHFPAVPPAALVRAELRARLAWQGALRLRVDAGTGAFRVGPAALPVALSRFRGRYDPAPGRRSHLDLQLGPGGRVLRARLRLRHARRPGAADKGALTLQGRLQPALLEALGLPTGVLRQALVLSTQLRGSPTRFRAQLGLLAPALQLSLTARRRGGQLHGTLSATSPRLAALVAGAPAASAALKLSLAGVQQAQGWRAKLRLSDVAWDGVRYPEVAAAVRTGPGRVRLQWLSAPGLPGGLKARGLYQAQGRSHLALRLHLPSLRSPALRPHLPAVDGRVQGALQLTLDPPGPRRRIRARVSLQGDELVAGRAKLQQVALSARVHGAWQRPAVQGRLQVTGLQAGGLQQAAGTLWLRGGPRRYRLALQAAAQGGGALQVDGQWHRRAGSEALQLDGQLHLQAALPWQLQLKGAYGHRQGRVTLAALRIQHGGQRLAAEGQLGPGGRMRGALRLHRMRLESVLAALESRPLAKRRREPDRGPRWAGRVDGHVEVQGSVRRPALQAKLALRQAKFAGVPWQQADLALDLDTAQRQIQVALQAAPGAGGQLSVRLAAALPRPRLTLSSLLQARYAVQVHSSLLSLAVLGPRGLGALQGEAAVDGEWQGTLPQLAGTLTFRGRGLRYGDFGPLDVQLQVRRSAEGGKTRVQAAVDDAQGAWLRADLQTPLTLPATRLEVLRWPETLRALPGTLTLQLAQRRLDQLAWWGPRRIALPFRVAARLSAVRDANGQVQGRLQATGQWLATQDAPACGEERPLTLRLAATLQPQEATLQLRGWSGRRPVLQGRVQAPIALGAWLQAGLPQAMPPVAADLRWQHLELGQLPWTCSTVRGRVRGQLTARRWLTSAPLLQVKSHIEGLRQQDGAALQVALKARLRRQAMRATLSMSSRGGGCLRAGAVLPLTWTARRTHPRWTESRDYHAWLRLRDFSLDPLASFTAQVRNLRGRIGGWARVRGRGEAAPAMRGALYLHGVSLAIAEPAQRIEEARGTLLLQPGRLSIRDLHARDQDGQLALSGHIDLQGFRPRRGRLRVVADKLPVRQEGTPVAYVSTTSKLRLQRRALRQDIGIDVADLAIQVPDTSPPSLQALSAHPDLRVAGTMAGKTPRARSSSAKDMSSGKEAKVATHVRVDAPHPFWVRGPGFAVQLQAHLRARMQAQALRVRGQVRFRRGFFELLGERFLLAHGRIDFTGEKVQDPVVELRLVHRLRRLPGEQLFIDIQGPLSHPQLVFSATVPGVSTAGDALLLMAGQQEDADPDAAGNETGAILSGIAASVLTLTARRELGDAVPVISIESGDGAAGGTVRLGYNADWAIPGFLKPYIVGAYVEGYLSGDAKDGGGTSAGRTATRPRAQSRAGVVIEYYFPHHLTSKAEYAPPQNWGIDLLWSPTR